MRNGFRTAAAIGAASIIAPLVVAASLYIDYTREQAALARRKEAYPYAAKIDGEPLRDETGDPLMFDTPAAAARYARDVSTGDLSTQDPSTEATSR